MRNDEYRQLTRQANVIGLALAVTLLLLAFAMRSVFEQATQDQSVRSSSLGGGTPSPAYWITADDYPAAAINANLQGTTRIAMTFAPDGHMTACKVSESSGHPILDLAACDAAMRRGRLAAVSVASGDRTVSRRVVWRLPEP